MCIVEFVVLAKHQIAGFNYHEECNLCGSWSGPLTALEWGVAQLRLLPTKPHLVIWGDNS